MADIVERLRTRAANADRPRWRDMHYGSAEADDDSEAADTIDALRAENARLREALKPFGALGEAMTKQSPDDNSPWVNASDNTPYGAQGLTFGDYRRARAALTREGT